MTDPLRTLTVLDAETTVLVRLAAALAGGTEVQVHELLVDARDAVRGEWVEEVILQTYLFAGFPRALNGMREWRRLSAHPAPVVDPAAVVDRAEQQRRGMQTCQVVYGPRYDRLRHTIAALHPSLDSWMIEEGYGKVLSRAGLDLCRRELCIVSACAISRQDRQLHAHLHGALNAGVSVTVVESTLEVLYSMLSPDDRTRIRAVWARVQSASGVD